MFKFLKKIWKLQAIKDYIITNFEQVFVLTIIVVTPAVYYFTPYKMAFLNVFYLPILLAGYFLGKRYSVLGGFFAIILVGIFVCIDYKSFYIGVNKIDVIFNLITWGGFLLLAGYITGHLHERLINENKMVISLNESLKETNEQLKKYSEKLSAKAKELEEKNAIVTHLKERLENALYSTLDTRIAKLIIEKRIRNEKLRISILFSDLVGFSDFSDKNRPEIVIDELNKFFGIMEPIIIKFKGHIDKYLGDGIMCEFGAPVGYNLHALHAVVAGLKMQEALKTHDPPWNMRIGISTGYAITGLIGERKRSYTAIGDVVNLAARLQEICPEGGLAVDEETLNEVEPYIKYERIRGTKEKKEDAYIQKEIEAHLEKLKEKPHDVKLLFETGKLYFELYDVTRAIKFFEKALKIDPNDSEIKVAYADAILKKDYYEKIPIKGKKERVAVYVILGLKDPIEDRTRIPEPLYNEFKSIEPKIKPLEDIMLPVEVIDGSIGTSKIVATISHAIANELGLTDSEREKILIGAYFHDIGKDMVSPYLLNREGTLTDSEFREIMKHSLEGVVTLQTMGYNDETILSIVRDHHEYFDGSGYPDGKKGEEIPLGARIVCVADTYSALTSTRPYRDAWDKHAAIREIQRGAQQGKYDKNIVDILIKIME